METESMDHDPLQGHVDQDEDAIERSLELLRADLSEQHIPVDVAMMEVEQTLPNQDNDVREANEPDEKEEEILRIEGDISDEVKPPTKPSYRVQVVVPEISLEERAQYSFAHSHIVESVLGEAVHDTVEYRVEFTDGREELVGGYSFYSKSSFICSWAALTSLYCHFTQQPLLSIVSQLQVSVRRIQNRSYFSTACLIHCRAHKYILFYSAAPHHFSLYRGLLLLRDRLFF